MSISEFTKEFRFLSNFWTCSVTLENKLYRTVEHAYQASKTLDDSVRETIRAMLKPGDAKKFGKTVTVRGDWEEIKIETMRKLVRQKFQNPFLQPLLLATEDQELIEGNPFHDIFWGVCNCKKHQGTGDNFLGKLLMEIRDEIRNEVEKNL